MSGWPPWTLASIGAIHTAATSSPDTALRATADTASDTPYDAAFEAFVGKKAKIVVNNEDIERDAFKADLRKDAKETATVTFLNSVDVQEHQDDALVEPQASIMPLSSMDNVEFLHASVFQCGSLGVAYTVVIPDTTSTRTVTFLLHAKVQVDPDLPDPDVKDAEKRRAMGTHDEDEKRYKESEGLE
ncbi:hypothetical protein DENSPDRAFT_854020 [Dentipellis sp. KUC8613]|nr:hypothetical protein DENSPDRAFT_854020 [Dentipellis sp. KUC8613]